jgi:hypothetical protein
MCSWGSFYLLVAVGRFAMIDRRKGCLISYYLYVIKLVCRIIVQSICFDVINVTWMYFNSNRNPGIASGSNEIILN